MTPTTLRQWMLLSLVTLSPLTLINGLRNSQHLDALKNLLRDNFDAETKIAALSESLAELDEAKLPAELRIQADKCEAWAEQPYRFLVPMNSTLYPALLLTTPDPPPLLYVQGNVQTLTLPQVAVVGSRKPGSDGRKLAFSFAAQLCARGYQITSGLAYGVDAASHEGALHSGKPTIAVLGTGLNEIYPKGHQKLAQTIMENGALVSEFSPDTKPLSWHFPQRNRIISGMSHGVLVVEAAISSGSLITARLAAEQGRLVFAIPGSIHNPMSKGCHRLIRQGAILVESADDILAELDGLLQWEHQQLADTRASQQAGNALDTLSAEQQKLLAQIAYNPLSVDELSVVLNMEVTELYSHLMTLELEGWVECRAGAYIRNHAHSA